ncbi:hypothetical protein [Frankia sp. AgKG'84/4]|uniref:hypothetical protein n=1 Tax=Frankia sp. AgKG'84/4 TaxID=573490 RepID=UPI00200F127A|nr:hypothetical protein [Frankia sp. AgKG'84/4]MCL9797221.1 hypothetical protein [Frankia sp. AgKG'84/4]
MASISTKINDFLHSPKTREMVDKAKAAANKPENRAKIKQMQEKVTNRTRGHGHSNTPGAPPPPPTGHGTDAGAGATREPGVDKAPGAGHVAGTNHGYGSSSGNGYQPGAAAPAGETPSASGYDQDVAPRVDPADPGARPGY